MTKPYIPNLERDIGAAASDAEHGERLGSLEDHMPIDDDVLSDGEVNDIGELGNELDDAGGVDGLLKELSSAPPTRMALLMHRVAESIQALRSLRSGPAPAWAGTRLADEHWRALADEALGLIGAAASREVSEQKLIQTLPIDERESIQILFDSRRGLGVFRKGFDAERKAWEQAYWKRALDESFGKRPWRGPAGCRVQQ